MSIMALLDRMLSSISVFFYPLVVESSRIATWSDRMYSGNGNVPYESRAEQPDVLSFVCLLCANLQSVMQCVFCSSCFVSVRNFWPLDTLAGVLLKGSRV
jgi:hypothetical protein